MQLDQKLFITVCRPFKKLGQRCFFQSDGNWQNKNWSKHELFLDQDSKKIQRFINGICTQHTNTEHVSTMRFLLSQGF